MTRRFWLELDFDAPTRGLAALDSFLHNVRAGDPVELAVAAGALPEQEAANRLMALIHSREELAERLMTLPDTVVEQGGVPADVPPDLRLPGGGEAALHALREELAPYVALTPVLNQEEWARAWQPEPGFRHIVVDNASDDGTAEILAERGADVVINPSRLSRVDNWQRALAVFVERSDAQWMKWIFAGDRLVPGAAGVLDRAIAAHPAARMITAEYDLKLSPGHFKRMRAMDETRLVWPPESMFRCVVQGNWLSGPIALALHRDVVGCLEFGSHPWVADWQAAVEVARRHPVLHVAERVGVFDLTRERYHRAHENDVYSIVQEFAMRYQALQHLRELAPEQDVREIERQLDVAVLAGVASRVQAKQNHAGAAA